MNFVITYDARSGSTLVSKLLTENFNSVVLPESNFIYIIEKNFDNKKKLYSKLISEKKFSDFRIKKKRLLNLINNNFKNKYDLIKLISYEASFNLYKSKKYAMFCKRPDWLDPNYEGVCIEFKDNEEYIIESLIGKIFYNNKDFNKCFKQESVILIELKNLFENKSMYKDHGIRAHEADPSGESKGSWHTFKLNDNSGWIYLECMDWTEEIGSYDNLRVTILGSEFGNFLNTEAY